MLKKEKHLWTEQGNCLEDFEKQGAKILIALFCHFPRAILTVRELQPFLDLSYYYSQKIEQSFSL